VDYRHLVIPVEFVLGYWFGVDVATRLDTVFLALLLVAIALDDFFSELLVDNSF
jgi:hypothetical protein